MKEENELDILKTVEFWNHNPLQTIYSFQKDPKNDILSLYNIGALKKLKREYLQELNQLQPKQDPLYDGILFFLLEKYQESFEILQQISKHHLAQFFLARIYYFDFLKTNEKELARDLWKKSANQGNLSSLFSLGLYYRINKQDEKAFQCFVKGSNQGYSASLGSLGKCYEYGEGCEIDLSKALYYYELSAEKEHDYAQFNLGYFYENGKGVKLDYAQAKYWYEKGAEQFDPASINNLGVMYLYGTGVEKDEKKAFELISKSADLNYTGALYNVGYCYYHGTGVPKNVDKAIEIFKKRAIEGYLSSYRMLKYHFFTQGTNDKNVRKAIEWFEQAVSHKLTNSITDYDDYKKMVGLK